MTVIKFHLLLTSGVETADVLRKPLSILATLYFIPRRKHKQTQLPVPSKSCRVYLLNE